MLIDYLTSIVVPLLKVPESFHVEETQDAMGMLLTIDLHPTDMGMVIGKAGTNAQAIRTLMRSYGALHNARISIKINEPQGGKFSHTGKTIVIKELDDAINEL